MLIPTLTSEEGGRQNYCSLPSLLIVKVKMAKCNALVGEMPLKDFSMFATSLLKSDYKVEDKNIIFTTAYAM